MKWILQLFENKKDLEERKDEFEFKTGRRM